MKSGSTHPNRQREKTQAYAAAKCYGLFLDRAAVFAAALRTGALRFADPAAFATFFRGARFLTTAGAGFASPVLTAIFPSVDPMA